MNALEEHQMNELEDRVSLLETRLASTANAVAIIIGKIDPDLTKKVMEKMENDSL